jgi:hypothetical protein
VLRRTTCITALLGLTLAGCGGQKHRGSSPSVARPVTSRPRGSRTGCRRVAQPSPKPNGGEHRPSTKLDPARTYEVTLETTCGDITIRQSGDQGTPLRPVVIEKVTVSAS